MKQAMQKWLNKFQIAFDTDTANKICDSFGLEGEKADGCVGLCYQLETGKITQEEFTGGLCVLTGKEAEEVMGVLGGVGNKEPWQMTRAEYRPIKEAKEEAHFKKVLEWLAETRGDPDAPYSLAELEAERPTLFAEYKILRTDHHRLVEQALREGKPVPPEVLEDYPGLRGKEPEEVMGVLKGMKVNTEETRVQIKPFYGKPDISGGGIFNLYKGDKLIGRAVVAFHHKDTMYPISGLVSAKTAVMDTMEIVEEERGKGYGSRLVDKIEKAAKEQGMNTIYLISVMGESEEFWRKKGYQFSGHKRIWIKELV